jgi:hypothetical protein
VAPYAPRFLLISPGPSGTDFPHPPVPNVTVIVINPTKADLLSNDNPIGTIELIQPDQVENAEDGAIIIGDGAGFVIDAEPLGGSAFVVPFETGSALGVYTVRVTMLDGAVAESRTVVVESLAPTAAPTSLPTHSLVPTASPTASPTSLPTHSPTNVPTNVPTSIPTQLPTRIPILRLAAVATNGPTSVPAQEVSARDYRTGLAVAAAVLLAGFVLYALFLEFSLRVHK